MGQDVFRSKQFSIEQDRCAMKVGTDGVLLGAWASVEKKKRILDIGSGTGLLALMAAQRNEVARIEAVELDPGAAGQANENFENSPWPDRLLCHHLDIEKLTPSNKFDLILTNPPYIKEGTLSPNKERGLARQAETLPLDKLFSNAERLSTDNATLVLIYPFAQRADLIQNALAKHWFLQRSAHVLPITGKDPIRLLAEFSKDDPNTSSPEQIIIRDKYQNYHSDYIALTREFHTIF